MDRDRAPDVSIVLACYQEEAHLETSVLEIMATMDRTPWAYELVFVEDCSRDRTREVIERILRKHGDRAPMTAIYHERNTGRGRSVSDGMRASTGRFVGFLDVDLEVHCRYLPSLVRALEEGADVVIARRVYRVSPSPTFLLRHVLSSGYHWLCNRYLGLGDLDTEAGFKFFRRSHLPSLLDACRDPGWFWDTEVTALAQLRGLQIVQIPALFLRRTDKKSTLRVLPAAWDYLKKLRANGDRLRNHGRP